MDKEFVENLKKLPYVITVEIFKYLQVRLVEGRKYDLLDFYGVFIADYSRKLFLIFNSFYTKTFSHLSFIPVSQVVHLDFSEEKRWNRNAFELPGTFLRSCKKLESIERVFFKPSDIQVISTVNTNCLVEKISCEVNFINDVIMNSINKMKSLKYLKLYSQQACTTLIDFTNTNEFRKIVLYKHCLGNGMFKTKGKSFDNLKTLEIFSCNLKSDQISTIVSMKVLKKLKLSSCNVGRNVLSFLNMKSLKSLSLPYCKMNKEDLKKVEKVDFQVCNIEYIDFTNVVEIPVIFLGHLFSRDSLKKVVLEGCDLDEIFMELALQKNEKYKLGTNKIVELDLRRNRRINKKKLDELKKKIKINLLF